MTRTSASRKIKQVGPCQLLHKPNPPLTGPHRCSILESVTYFGKRSSTCSNDYLSSAALSLSHWYVGGLHRHSQLLNCLPLNLISLHRFSPMCLDTIKFPTVSKTQACQLVRANTLPVFTASILPLISTSFRRRKQRTISITRRTQDCHKKKSGGRQSR